MSTLGLLQRLGRRRAGRHSAAWLLLLPLLLLLLLLLLLHPTPATAARGGSGGRRSPLDLSCRRLLQEFKDVMASGMALGVSAATSSLTNSTEHVRLAPCRGNLHEWHFTIAGPPGSVYEGGLYHGRVLLPADYPASAPRLQMLNPSGRFEVGADICLSATSFHQETWQPVWTVRTLVSALRSHMATKAVEVGGVEASAARRLVLAYRSRAFRCRHCGTDHARFVGSAEAAAGAEGSEGSDAEAAEPAEPGIFRSLPPVDLPPSVLKRQQQRAAAAAAGGAPVATKGGGGGGVGVGVSSRKRRGHAGGLVGAVLAVYRHRVPLVLGLLFLVFFVLLNAPPPPPPATAAAAAGAAASRPSFL